MAAAGGLVTADGFARAVAEDAPRSARMPVLFVGHGSPTNAIEDNEFSRAWAELAAKLPRPRAVLCVSAHWETDGAWVSVTPHPETIHDFFGFPEPLHAYRYPAPGSPEAAEEARRAVRSARVAADPDRGLDHGAWAVLCRMYPKADVPVFQLSLDRPKPAAWHYALGRELAGLRDRGVLIVGSGNCVHNLGRIRWGDTAHDWAVEFDAMVKRRIERREHQALVDYPSLGAAARLSVPTPEHYLPMLYALALQGDAEDAVFFAEKVTLGSISMRGFRIG